MKTDLEKPKIGVDIDEVIFPLMENYIKFHNERHGTNFKFENILNYNLWKTEIHKSREESINEVLEFQNSLEYDKISLIDGVKEILEEISKKYDIHFVTSRPLDIKFKTEALLNKNFNKKKFNILYSGDIYGGNLSKADICVIQGIFILIEDNPDYAIDCAKKGIKVFILRKPWNINCENHENIIKIDSLGEILELLK